MECGCSRSLHERTYRGGERKHKRGAKGALLVLCHASAMQQFVPLCRVLSGGEAEPVRAGTRVHSRVQGLVLVASAAICSMDGGTVPTSWHTKDVWHLQLKARLSWDALMLPQAESAEYLMGVASRHGKP